jgi:predicted Zn-dependent protease
LAFELNSAELAERFYGRAVAVRPTFAAARRQLGLTYATSGRLSEGAHELELAVRSEPADPVTHLNLAVAYAGLGRTPEARQQAQEALRLKPGYDKAMQLLVALK